LINVNLQRAFCAAEPPPKNTNEGKRAMPSKLGFRQKKGELHQD